ncbi:MAG: hypothetical protein J6O41_06025 [Clostridia bacterium]|nr:hypothetical protein [Clostridia bacterium]
MSTTKVYPRVEYVSYLTWFISNRVLTNKPVPISSECTNQMIEQILTANWNNTYAENYNGGIHIHITRETYEEMLTSLSISADKYESFFASFDIVVKKLTNTTTVNWVCGESGPLDIYCK